MCCDGWAAVVAAHQLFNEEPMNHVQALQQLVNRAKVNGVITKEGRRYYLTLPSDYEVQHKKYLGEHREEAERTLRYELELVLQLLDQLEAQYGYDDYDHWEDPERQEWYEQCEWEHWWANNISHPHV
jgi:hypothetical protein